MNTNININAAMAVISAFIRENEKEFGHYHAATLIPALEIAMNNNIVKSNDNYASQILGTAMGKPPAPC